MAFAIRGEWGVNRADREIAERLGADGLSRALDDLLDQAQLVRLANACALRYPGMRPQSQSRERLLGDLVGKCLQDDAARRTILRALRKASGREWKAWVALSPDERAKRLADPSFPGGNGRLGVHLFVLASGPAEDAADAVLGSLLERAVPVRTAAPSDGPSAVDASDLARETARQKKKSAELQKKVAHLEGQITRSRDLEKALKRDLLQRKGELAESRMLAERLSRELQETKDALASAAASPSPSAAAEALEPITAAVRKLATEQRRLAHRIDRLADASQAATSDGEPLAAVQRSVDELHREIASLRRERKKDFADHGRRIEEIRAETRALRSAAEAALPSPKATARRKGEPERVSVFIDVQNMYYAARQLKGKLDFDALLQAAVRERRLIQASAYVVETKEIDQSGFIAMLQQRAIEVRRKTLKIRSDGSMKGDWDMEMALDILDAAPRVDVVVLVSGDGDFTSLVNRVKRIGPRVEVIGFPRNTAKSLLEAADRFQPLDRKFMIRTEDDASGSTRRSRAGPDTDAGDVESAEEDRPAAARRGDEAGDESEPHAPRARAPSTVD